MRIIHYGNDNGSIEGLHFTEDTKSPAEELVTREGCTVLNDFDPEVDGWPGDFPTDHTFEKKNY